MPIAEQVDAVVHAAAADDSRRRADGPRAEGRAGGDAGMSGLRVRVVSACQPGVTGDRRDPAGHRIDTPPAAAHVAAGKRRFLARPSSGAGSRTTLSGSGTRWWSSSLATAGRRSRPPGGGRRAPWRQRLDRRRRMPSVARVQAVAPTAADRGHPRGRTDQMLAASAWSLANARPLGCSWWVSRMLRLLPDDRARMEARRRRRTHGRPGLDGRSAPRGCH